jgi:hypothetical protein
MKKYKDSSIVDKNKLQLFNYLSDFSEDKKGEILKMFIEGDFNCGISSFRDKMKKKIAMPKFGKRTLIYWLSRGWSEEESLLKRKHIKRDPEKSPMNINFWVNKGYSEKDAESKVKSQRKLNKEYWINRGYNEIEAIEQVSYFQRQQSEKLNKKIKLNPEKYKGMFNTQIEYWIKKGFDLEESKNMLLKRQKTFSKEICIEKNGEEMGLIIWKNRQEKWINSLNMSQYNLSDGKGIKIKERLKKHKVKNIIKSLSISNKDIFIYLIDKCKTINDFIQEYSRYINSDDEISLYRILKPICSLKILQEYYCVSKNDILSLIIPKITQVKSKYSNYTWFNGHICRSDGEYIIANFLFKNNLIYSYENTYNNSKLRCDFYLTDYDLYIEYCGMKANSYDKKIKFLVERNINFIASDNVDDLKNKIIEYVNNKSR